MASVQELSQTSGLKASLEIQNISEGSWRWSCCRHRPLAGSQAGSRGRVWHVSEVVRQNVTTLVLCMKCYF